MPKPYRVYYCLYYYFIGFWVINFPKLAKPSLDKVFCRFYSDSKLKGFSHHNFLFADYIKHIPENKWFFTQRKFAFRVINTNLWYKLPSLTVCHSYNNKIKYGLNSTFTRKWSKKKLEFCTWNPSLSLFEFVDNLSGIQDSNLQPHAPHACALANCANPRSANILSK